MHSILPNKITGAPPRPRPADTAWTLDHSALRDACPNSGAPLGSPVPMRQVELEQGT